MRIMEMVSASGVNGAVMHAMMVTRELTRRGHAVTLVCRPGAWIAGEMADDPIEIVLSDMHRWPADELRRMAKLIQERDIEVLHMHNSRANFFGVLQRHLIGVPTVATAHNCRIQLHWMFNDWVIGASQATLQFHRRYNFVRSRRSSLVHNFIDPSRFANVAPDARPRLRAAWGAGDDTTVVGIVGSVIARKGQRVMVKALARLDAARTRLVLVGDGSQEYAADVRRCAERLGVDRAVVWAGERSDIPEILSALDIFALPSFEEEFPLSIIEAMAAGLPVVATTVGGVAECVVPGQTGALVRPGDVPALARAIDSLAADPATRRQWGQAGRERVSQRFTAASQMPLIEQALQTAANRRRKGATGLRPWIGALVGVRRQAAAATAGKAA